MFLTPHSDHLHGLADFPAGYPVVVDNHVSQQRTAQLVQYMRDGGYLNPQLTDTLTMTVSSGAAKERMYSGRRSASGRRESNSLCCTADASCSHDYTFRPHTSCACSFLLLLLTLPLLPLLRLPVLQFVSYNPMAVVFGYFSATFTWLDSGDISMNWDILVSKSNAAV